MKQLLCVVLGLRICSPTRRLPLTLPHVPPLDEDLPRPGLDLLTLDLLCNPRELAQIPLTPTCTLILDHLQQQLHLVDIMYEEALFGHTILVLLPYRSYVCTIQSTVEIAKQVGTNVVHCLGFTSTLLFLGHMVYGGDVTDQRFSHVVDERHATAFQYVESRGKRSGSHHGEDGHAVHVVGNGLAIVNAEAAPASALGSLEALEQVEEGDGGRCVLGVSGKDVGKQREAPVAASFS